MKTVMLKRTKQVVEEYPVTVYEAGSLLMVTGLMSSHTGFYENDRIMILDVMERTESYACAIWCSKRAKWDYSMLSFSLLGDASDLKLQHVKTFSELDWDK